VAPDQTLAYVQSITAERDPARASDIATAALAKGLRHPEIHIARARWLQLNDRNGEALDELKQAIALAPHDVEVLQAIGISQIRLGRSANAIAALDTAIRIAPANAQTHFLKGCAYSAAGEAAPALRAHERAIALQPNHANALAAAAAAGARSGEMARARKWAERALRSAPEHPTAAVALAMCDLHDKEFARAETGLRGLLSTLSTDDETRALALGLLGDALDGQDQPDQAFESYTAKNLILRNIYSARFGGASRLLNRMEQLISNMNEEPVVSSTPASSFRPPPRQHVFLLGFMRSGTTLLEQVLATHPDVETLEERETLANLFPPGRDKPERTGLQTADGIAQARETYWQRVRDFGAKPDDKVFIEKQPFNTLNFPLIAHLFPAAKIIFLVRDPRDVILSCFRRHLEVKPTTFELLNLADAARFYDRVMHFAMLCRSRLDLNLFECRYENIVSDFDSSIRAVCNYLEMPWTVSMRDFDRSARSRTIRSVSSNQVRQGLYPGGVGYWRRYERHLAPILPMLQPWVERFGYPVN
jgi:Flp pilus assembly protein TadD